MTGYERTMYERDLPGIRKSLESIAASLQEIQKRIIVSDPGDEVEHIEELPGTMPEWVKGLKSAVMVVKTNCAVKPKKKHDPYDVSEMD